MLPGGGTSMPEGNPEDNDGPRRLADCTASVPPPGTEQVCAGRQDHLVARQMLGATLFLAIGGRPLWLLRRVYVVFEQGRVVEAKGGCTSYFRLASGCRRGAGLPPPLTMGRANLRCNGGVAY
jgi:hypothetical protein